MFYDIFNSPLGKIVLATDGQVLTEVHLDKDRFFKQIPVLWQENQSLKILKTAKAQLKEYFEGKLQQFSLPLSFSGTELQNQTWTQLQKIPFGTTISYKELASRTSKPKAIRAVASAVGRNPISIIIPCHRIIASDGSLGGYGSGLNYKISLLKLEKNANIA